MAAVMADQSTGENRGENRLEMALWSTTGVEKWLNVKVQYKRRDPGHE